jgi:hypothetical protein
VDDDVAVVPAGTAGCHSNRLLPLLEHDLMWADDYV